MVRCDCGNVMMVVVGGEMWLMMVWLVVGFGCGYLMMVVVGFEMWLW